MNATAHATIDIHLDANAFRPERQNVTFDPSVRIDRLSYRWSPLPGGARPMLDLFHDGQPLMKLYGPAGVAEFVFADGRSLTLDRLLAQLPRAAEPPAFEFVLSDAFR